MPMATRDGLYPIGVFEDRYSGAYAGGAWVAVAGLDSLEDGRSRFWLAFEGAHGDDLSADRFWEMHQPTPWLAVGKSPEEAVSILVQRMARLEHA